MMPLNSKQAGKIAVKIQYEQPFVGYYSGWNKCDVCGVTLVRKTIKADWTFSGTEEVLRHESKHKDLHWSVAIRKAELKGEKSEAFANTRTNINYVNGKVRS